MQRLHEKSFTLLHANHFYTYEKCCTDTIEGQRFHRRREKFVELMVSRGAVVHFDIKQIEGTGRAGAISHESVLFSNKGPLIMITTLL